jgi:hypothetical protein
MTGLWCYASYKASVCVLFRKQSLHRPEAVSKEIIRAAGIVYRIRSRTYFAGVFMCADGALEKLAMVQILFEPQFQRQSRTNGALASFAAV